MILIFFAAKKKSLTLTVLPMTCTCDGFGARWVSIASSIIEHKRSRFQIEYVPGVWQLLCGALDWLMLMLSRQIHHALLICYYPAGSDYCVEKTATWKRERVPTRTCEVRPLWTSTPRRNAYQVFPTNQSTTTNSFFSYTTKQQTIFSQQINNSVMIFRRAITQNVYTILSTMLL